MIAYKFLGQGAVALYSAFPWPAPQGQEPGRWVNVSGPLEPCGRGIHACRLHDLPSWIDDELWLIELGGRVIEEDTFVVGERGRLVRQMEDWNPAAAQAFAEVCAWRARDHAAAVLRDADRAREAAELSACRELTGAQALAAANARGMTGPAGEASAFVADTVALVLGKRPDDWEADGEGAHVTTPGAIAANLGIVTAHAAGRAAVGRAGDQAYMDAFAAERSWQLSWLVEQLGLKDS